MRRDETQSQATRRIYQLKELLSEPRCRIFEFLLLRLFELRLRVLGWLVGWLVELTETSRQGKEGNFTWGCSKIIAQLPRTNEPTATYLK